MLRITQYRCPYRIDCHQRSQQDFHFSVQQGFIRIAVRPQAQQFQLSGFYLKQQVRLSLRQRQPLCGGIQFFQQQERHFVFTVLFRHPRHQQSQ